jgi:guanylate kinase
MTRPTLLVVSGPSGAGKSTLCDRLREEFPGFQLSVSYTTRAPRGNEVDGEHYHFVSRERFEKMIEEGAFVEWASVHGNLYGTARHVIEEALDAGCSLLFDIDYQGALLMRAAFAEALCVMLLPPSIEELERRLRGRGTDSEEVIARRMANALGEIAQVEAFDFLIFNESVEPAYNELRAVVLAHEARRDLRLEEVEQRFPQAFAKS